jgi:HD-like signal output (HDOD) protein/ActR/RegA family two-component response regulator
MKRVLFVDDEVRILDGLRRMLRPARDEWEMEFAAGGQAALEVMAGSAFDVVISDMRMPGMDGAALLEQVRERFPEVVRIVLSGHTEMAHALRVVPIAHQFLAKPCDAVMLRLAIERAFRLRALLTDGSVRSLVGALGDLPALPRIYQALNNALVDPDSSLQKISGIVEQDIGISAKILQLANSAFFGNAQPVASIQNAVGYMGLNALKCLVLSLEIFRAFEPKAKVPGFSMDAMQRHAQLTAHIVARLPVPKHLAEVAFVSSMLHDVGKLIQAWKLPESFGQAIGESAEDHLPLYKVEERKHGFSHAEIGAYLLGIWGLPYPVVETVALHHSPTRVPHQEFDAIAGVYVANLLAHRLDSDPDGADAECDFGQFEEDLAALGVLDQIGAWQEMVKDVPAQMAEAEAA